MVAGAPFFFGDGEADGVASGGSLVPGVAVGLKEGVEESAGVGVGEGLCLFFGTGLGEESGLGPVEDFCFFFGEADALSSGFSAGVGLPEVFFFFEEEGDGDFFGVTDGFGVGDLSSSSFFVGAVELLRCFRGVGVGVGAKIFLILLPNDSSACARWVAPRNIAIRKKVPTILLTCRMERESSTGAGGEYALDYTRVIPSRADRDRDLGGAPTSHQSLAPAQERNVQPLNRVALSLVARKSISVCEVPRPAAAGLGMTRKVSHATGLRSLTSWRAPPEQLCSSECPHPCSRAGSSRSANAPGNPAAPDPAAASPLREWCGIPRRSGCCLPRG